MVANAVASFSLFVVYPWVNSNTNRFFPTIRWEYGSNQLDCRSPVAATGASISSPIELPNVQVRVNPAPWAKRVTKAFARALVAVTRRKLIGAVIIRKCVTSAVYVK